MDQAAPHNAGAGANGSDAGGHMDHSEKGRRDFLKSLALGAAGAAMLTPQNAQAAAGGTLQVWSCGGLAEAMMPAHAAYEQQSGDKIVYTGAFAAALGKSLLTGGGQTEVFAGRVLALAQNLRKSGKMVNFRPLCFTSYVIAVPKGNPAKIAGIEDLTRPGVRVAMAQDASAPGGQAVMGILKAADITAKVLANVREQGSCVQRSVADVTERKADAMIVERRITRMARFADNLEYVEIPEQLFPAGPLTFTVGMMANAADPARATAYMDWITSAQGQRYFEAAGFIPAISPKGMELVEKLGVKDVA